MKFGLTISLLLTAVCGVLAQSGRVKPAETPTPKPVARTGTGAYVPTQLPSTVPVDLPVGAPTSKDDDSVIKVESALVPIPASVIDVHGRSIANLRLDDFELKIDGKPAEVSELSRAETPIRLALLFDNSSSVLIARDFEKEAAMRFLRRVIRSEKDLAALFSVATVSRLEQPFTREISALVQAIQLFPPPEGATALLEGIILAADYVRDVSGRRVVVIVSDGDDTKSDSTLQETVRSLLVANCQVYVVKTTDFENYKRTGSRRGNANLRQLAAERRMQEIADQTGGAVYSPIDERELDDAFRQISAELSQQYILSYYPESESGRGGEFRQISLGVRNRQNLTVRTRKGYYVPKK
jgi:Ca-activated chloride channel homolog